MLITKDNLSHVSSISHEGKLVVLATDSQGVIWYTVKQDGFEDSYLSQPPDQRTGWEFWQQLQFPDEKEDQSVLEKQADELTDQNTQSSYLYRSRYQTGESAVAPVQLVSAQGHLYVFRQSPSNRLWVDRFVLDGLTNTLVRKLEVRYKRSRQKYTPAKVREKAASKLLDIDSLDFTDINGKNFYEPTTELSLVGEVDNGWFSVVLLPTNEQDKQRWHIFAYNLSTRQVELTSLLASEEGLFDVKDYTILQPEARTLPGITRRTFDIGNPGIMHGLHATRFDVQRERQTDDGLQLLRDSVRVMLVISTDRGDVSALNFAVSADGMLVGDSAEPVGTRIMRSDEKQVLLPLNTLEQIKAIGTSNPPQAGVVEGLARGDNDAVVIKTAGDTHLPDAEITHVQISNYPDYNQVYPEVAQVIDADTFVVNSRESANGHWEVIPEQETGLIFNGAVTAYEVLPDGKLKVSALNHGLEQGDTVQIVDTQSCNGTYSVSPIDSTSFSLDGVRWRTGSVISAKLQAAKRRGVLCGSNGSITVPAHPNPVSAITVSLWVKSTSTVWQGAGYLMATGNAYVLEPIPGSKAVAFRIGTESGVASVEFEPDLDITQWNHVAGTFDGETLRLYINGWLVSSTEFSGKLVAKADTLDFGYTDQSGSSALWQLSEASLWEKARSAEDILRTLYLPLSGQEPGLLGYWRLNAILEGKERKVIDFSPSGLDGVVNGGAYLSSVTLGRRNSVAGTDAIRFLNEELIAVTERASYVEEFEFQTDNALDLSGEANKPFSISCRGKHNRSAPDWVTVAVSATEFAELDDGWYRASVRFTVPDGVSLLRSFSIEEFDGAWSSLSIRKHSIVLVSNSISEASYSEDISALSVIGDNADTTAESVATIRRLEPEQIELLREQRQLAAQIEEYENLIANRDQAIKDNRTAQGNKQYEITRLNSQLQHASEAVQYWTLANTSVQGVVTFHWNNGRSGDSFSRGVGAYSSMPTDWNDEVASISVPSNLYVVLYEDTHFRGGAMRFNTNHNLSDWDIPDTNTNWKNETSSFKIKSKVGDFTDAGLVQRELNSAVNEMSRISKALAKANSELARLKQFSATRDVSGELDRARRRKAIVDNRLKEVESTLKTSNDQFLRALAPAGAYTMPEVMSDTESLSTTGAVLGFVNPSSRIHTLESCEGTVQLDYFDQAGCMRRTLFDATADSDSTTFNQWLRDGHRACLDFRESYNVVSLDKATPDSDDWSIEAWVYYPGLYNTRWNTLVRSDSGDHQIIVSSDQKGSFLGSYLNNRFYSCDYDMRQLSAGWYHLAAVGQGKDDKASTTFYINGAQVGESLSVKSEQGVSTIGNRVNTDQQFGKVCEVRIWSVALTAEEMFANSKLLLTGQEPGLQAYLRFDEGKGDTVLDRTGNGHNGRISGARWFACTAAIGNLNNPVIQFDGNDDYIEVAENASLNPAEFTISCWAKVTGGQGTYRSPLTSRDDFQGYMFYAGNNDKWQVWVGTGDRWQSVAGPEVVLGEWVHLCATYSNRTLTLLVNGISVGSKVTEYSRNLGSPLRIGAGATEQAPLFPFVGNISEVCVWNRALSVNEIVKSRHQRLVGSEPGLVACFPLDQIVSVDNLRQVVDCRSKYKGTLAESVLAVDPQLPVGSDALISAEYSTVGKDRTAMMRRFFATLHTGGVSLISGQRVDLLDLKWVGNGQFAPTLLGYMEGPPPIPSENLTFDEDYRAATSVELELSEDVEFNWTRSQDAGLGASIDAYIGSDVTQSIVTAPLGVGAEIESVGIRAGFKGNLDFSYQFQHESSITSSSSLSMTDTLKLTGTQEERARFRHLGKRFVPKNVGYALVVSSIADVFVTRLQRRNTMIGYQVLPVENMPPDVNTITFMINPAYTMSGSLDGMTGSGATSERFHKHVPDMRAHFGSLYPASYFRLQEAYDLKRQIEQQDKNRQAYFEQFNSLLVDQASIEQDVDVDVASEDGTVISRNSSAGQAQTDEQKAEAARKIEEDAKALEQDTEKRQQKQAEQVKKRREAIDKHIADQEQRSHASASFDAWQTKMETIQTKAGKRNIVNTYVWDADGGLRAESQSFANTAEHSIGGSFSLNAALGAEGNFSVLGASVELTAQATVNMTQTMSKTESRSQGIQLNVDLDGVESRGVTDHHDMPLLPGEKVNRYRFMSFYLEGSTGNFNDFYQEVVDPEWLASNSEEARALRQARGKANKAWRVLHRVTYVERPALMGFGRDLRTLPGNEQKNEIEQIRVTVDALKKQNDELQKKLDAILKRVTIPT